MKIAGAKYGTAVEDAIEKIVYKLACAKINCIQGTNINAWYVKK